MARIGLVSGFQVIPEGRHVFKIVATSFKEDFGKMEIKLKTKEGLSHTERYSFKTKSGESNDKALAAFSYFAKVALNDMNIESIDEKDLVGHYFSANVEHNVVPSNKDPKKTVTFIQLTDREVADGFEGGEAESDPVAEEPTEAPTEEPTQEEPKKAKSFNLDDIL